MKRSTKQSHVPSEEKYLELKCELEATKQQLRIAHALTKSLNDEIGRKVTTDQTVIELQQKTNECNALQRVLVHFESQFQACTEQVKSLEARLADEQEKNKLVEATHQMNEGQVQQDLKRSKKYNRELKAENSSLKSSILSAEQNRKQYVETIAQLQSTLSKYEVQKQQDEQQLRELQERLHQVISQYQDKSFALNNFRDNFHALELETKQQQQRLQQNFDQQMKTVREESQKCQNEVEQLRIEYEEMNVKYSTQVQCLQVSLEAKETMLESANQKIRQHDSDVSRWHLEKLKLRKEYEDTVQKSTSEASAALFKANKSIFESSEKIRELEVQLSSVNSELSDLKDKCLRTERECKSLKLNESNLIALYRKLSVPGTNRERNRSRGQCSGSSNYPHMEEKSNENKDISNCVNLNNVNLNNVNSNNVNLNNVNLNNSKSDNTMLAIRKSNNVNLNNSKSDNTMLAIRKWNDYNQNEEELPMNHLRCKQKLPCIHDHDYTHLTTSVLDENPAPPQYQQNVVEQSCNKKTSLRPSSAHPQRKVIHSSQVRKTTTLVNATPRSVFSTCSISTLSLASSDSHIDCSLPSVGSDSSLKL